MRQPDATDVAEIDQPAVGADEVWFEATVSRPLPDPRTANWWLGRPSRLPGRLSISPSIGMSACRSLVYFMAWVVAS